MTIKAKSQHIAYLEISPSKRRDVRKRSLPMSIQEVFHNEPKKNHSAMDDFSGEDDTTCNDMFTDNTRSSTYSRREEKAAANWSEVREQLLNASVETSIPISSALCIVCDHPADTVCLDCGAHAYYCSEHVENVHSKTNIFHRPRLWKVSSCVNFCKSRV